MRVCLCEYLNMCIREIQRICWFTDPLSCRLPGARPALPTRPGSITKPAAQPIVPATAQPETPAEDGSNIPVDPVEAQVGAPVGAPAEATAVKSCTDPVRLPGARPALPIRRGSITKPTARPIVPATAPPETADEDGSNGHENTVGAPAEDTAVKSAARITRALLSTASRPSQLDGAVPKPLIETDHTPLISSAVQHLYDGGIRQVGTEPG